MSSEGSSAASSWCGTRPITAAATARYRVALAPVPSSQARPTFWRGLRTHGRDPQPEQGDAQLPIEEGWMPNSPST
jgi:hypothetical protein